MGNGQVNQGGCLCGAVRYEVTGPLRDVVFCHCGQCQKSSGHFFAATSAAADRFRLTADRGLKWYNSSEWAERGFCRECGSNLFWRMKAGGPISILAGSFDAKHGLRATSHIFIKDKKDYYEIADGLPQYAAYPEEMLKE